MYKSLYGCMLSFPWGKYLEVELMGFYSGLCLTYYETAQLFSKVFVLFYIPTCSVWEFWLFHVFANVWYGQSFQILATLIGV